MISVPLALLFPITFLPHRFSSSAISSGGKPVSVKVLNGFSVLIPIISQCPVMVSLPLLASLRHMKCPAGFSTPVIFLAGWRFSIPSFLRFGISRDPIFSRICPKVSTPVSPKFAESGIAPIPRESSTITKTLS